MGRSERDDSEASPREILLMGEVLVACYHKVKTGLFGCGQQLAVGQPGPAHFGDRGDGKAGQLVADASGHVLVKQDAAHALPCRRTR